MPSKNRYENGCSFSYPFVDGDVEKVMSSRSHAREG